MANDLDDLAFLTYQDTEGGERYYAALQRQINSGQIWLLEGHAGRTAMAAINQGLVMVGLESRRDYWGNKIPSRSELQPGTKGTRGYVVKLMNEAWAQMLEREEVK